MWKRLIALIVALGALGVMATGMMGAGAWFVDSEQSAWISISSGTLDLAVEGALAQSDGLELSESYQSLGWFCVTNVGTTDVKWRGWLAEVQDEQGLAGLLLLRMVLNPVEHVGSYGGPQQEFFTDLPLLSFVGENSFFVLEDAHNPFASGQKACFDLQVRLAPGLDAQVPSGRLNTKLFIEGTQINNQSWHP